MTLDWLDAYVNYFVFIYGISFFALPVGILLKHREIAHFNLTDNFIGLAAFGLFHGTADLMHLVPSYISMTQTQARWLTTAKILIDMISFQFLAHFAVTELTEPKTRLKTLFLFSPVVISIYYFVGITIVNSTKQAYYASLYFLALPSIALAIVSFLSLSKRFREIDMHSLARDFFALAAVFFVYALTKLWPAYSSFGVISPKGVPVMIVRAAAAFTVALLMHESSMLSSSKVLLYPLHYT